MKAELIIEGRSARSMDFATTPHAGDVLFLDGERISVKEIVHDLQRRKLQVVCQEPNPFAAFCHSEPAILTTEGSHVSDSDEL